MSLEEDLTELQRSFDDLSQNLDDFFLLVNGMIVFLMQCGFAFLEAGSVRAKNTTNILLKNTLDVCLGAIAYWGVGFAFAYGEPGNGFIGHSFFFFGGMDDSRLSTFFFQFVFAATAATIVSGAMAERTNFKAYLIYSVVITGFIYPVVSHWVWDSAGWINAGFDLSGTAVGYQDFAGSSVVHMVGGIAALAGAIILGPRIGRFDGDGSEFLGHTVPFVALGGFILFFGFFAFNGGSQLAISNKGDGVVVAIAFVNTVVSGSSAALVALLLEKFRLFGSKKWSLLTTINGGLTGMVAICAGCNSLYAWGALITGCVAGAVYIAVSSLMVKLKVDDPLDAVAVHLGGGLWGILSAPIFAREIGIVFAWDGPAFAGWAWNIVGAIVISIWTASLSIVLFGTLKVVGLLRIDEESELEGLDLKEHGEAAYPVLAYVGQDGIRPRANGTTNGLPQLVHAEAVQNKAYVPDEPVEAEDPANAL